jgi:hypothetical protein
LFGWPDEDHRSSCLAHDKWEPDNLAEILYLGFLVCSWTMTVTWPLYKRKELYEEIITALASAWPSLIPRGVVSMIGKLQSASLVALWGPYLSYGLSYALKLALQGAYSTNRHWWSRGKVWLRKSVHKDMACIAGYLLEPVFCPIWSPNTSIS